MDVEILTVSQKGQIVLPKKIRGKLSLAKGTKLLMFEDKGEITLRLAKGLISKKVNKIHSFPLLAAEKSLAKEWLSKEEDEAWKNL